MVLSDRVRLKPEFGIKLLAAFGAAGFDEDTGVLEAVFVGLDD